MSNSDPTGISFFGASLLLLGVLSAAVAFGLWFGVAGALFVIAVTFIVMGLGSE